MITKNTQLDYGDIRQHEQESGTSNVHLENTKNSDDSHYVLVITLAFEGSNPQDIMTVI